MVELGTVGRILRSTPGDAAVLVVTATATVVFDLVVAVEIGIVLASIVALRAVAQSTAFEQEPTQAVDIDTSTEHELIAEHIVTYRLDGALFFGAAQRFLLELADIADVEVVILRLGQLKVLDATGAQALGDIVSHLEDRGITVLLVSLRAEHRRVIEQVGVLDALAHQNHLLKDLDAGIEHARSHLRRRQSSTRSSARVGADAL
jgi:SulP family sulfate permease